MEAITIGGAAVLIVGGYYSIMDILQDFGINITVHERLWKQWESSKRPFNTPQIKIKKMTGMHI